MTMPHLMNCPHSPDGWCLDCVKRLQNELDDLFSVADELVCTLKHDPYWCNHPHVKNLKNELKIN